MMRGEKGGSRKGESEREGQVPTRREANEDRPCAAQTGREMHVRGNPSQTTLFVAVSRKGEGGR